MTKPRPTKPSLTARDVEQRFASEDACKELLTNLRWPDGKVACPRCGETKRVYRLRTRPFHWVCKNPTEKCPGVYRFSVLTGSVFESSNMPLTTWFRVAYIMATSKKGISALQIYRMMPPQRGTKGSYKTFWYMCHRIRAAMNDGDFGLSGIVEVDETYVGGSATNAHRGNRGKQTSAVPGRRGNLIPPKVAVIGAIARKGNVVCKVIEETDRKTLQMFVRQTVNRHVSLIVTDEHAGYAKLGQPNRHGAPGLPHDSVNHERGEYVKQTIHGSVHTQNIESFWSLVKRGIVGSFHKVSKDHLPLYLNEFAWRHNHRNDPEIFYSLLAGC
jgi:transposase-like protein